MEKDGEKSRNDRSIQLNILKVIGLYQPKKQAMKHIMQPNLEPIYDE